MRPLPPSARKETSVMPECTEAEREHVRAFLSAFDLYCATICTRLQSIPVKKRPPHVVRQLLQARDWRKAVKWMQSLNRKRRAKVEDLATMGFTRDREEVSA